MGPWTRFHSDDQPCLQFFELQEVVNNFSFKNMLDVMTLLLCAAVSFLQSTGVHTRFFSICYSSFGITFYASLTVLFMTCAWLPFFSHDLTSCTRSLPPNLKHSVMFLLGLSPSPTSPLIPLSRPVIHPTFKLPFHRSHYRTPRTHTDDISAYDLTYCF